MIQWFATTCLPKRVGIVLLLVTASCARFSSDSHADPRVDVDIRVDPHSPSTLRVETPFQPPSSMTKWVVRGSQWGKEVQVAEVRADDTLILADQQGHWQVPPHTKSLSWKVVLKEGAGESGFDPEEPRGSSRKPPRCFDSKEIQTHGSPFIQKSKPFQHGHQDPRATMCCRCPRWMLLRILGVGRPSYHPPKRSRSHSSMSWKSRRIRRWKQWIPDHTALVELLCQLFEPHNPSGSQLKKVAVIWRKVSCSTRPPQRIVREGTACWLTTFMMPRLEPLLQNIQHDGGRS